MTHLALAIHLHCAYEQYGRMYQWYPTKTWWMDEHGYNIVNRYCMPR